jgi:cardiolipin synthase
MATKRRKGLAPLTWPAWFQRLRAAHMALGVGLVVVAILLYANLASSERKVEHPIAHQYAASDSQFVRTMGSLLGPSFVAGNHVTALLNGDEVFPAMLGAIRAARRTITFESYIYWSSETGREFTAALSERARAGVHVHVLLDWAGSQKASRADLTRMKEAGVEVVMYRPLRWYSLDRVNHRTHRKLLIVDGRIGFTGGVGIADQWQGHGQDRDHWRDSQFRVEGPVVAQLQAAFMDDWFEVKGAVLDGHGYFPDLDPSGPALAQVFRSSPSGGNGNLRLMYLMAIAAASRRILIANSYFVPDRMTVTMLVEARRRGVDVELIVPGEILDAQLVRRASRKMWGPLLEAGVRIYEYQPTFMHAKYGVIDGKWSTIGSPNLNFRSRELDEENVFGIYDDALGARLKAEFVKDLDRAEPIDLEKWRARNPLQKFFETLSRILDQQS